jgi:hypothetical protein
MEEFGGGFEAALIDLPGRVQEVNPGGTARELRLDDPAPVLRFEGPQVGVRNDGSTIGQNPIEGLPRLRRRHR